MTTLLLIVVVAIEALIGAVLYYWTDVNVNTNTLVVIGVFTFFLGLWPAVELDSRRPWCPECHGAWSGRKMSSNSAPPETRYETVYDPSTSSSERRGVTFYQGSASYVCSRCGHPFNQTWKTRH